MIFRAIKFIAEAHEGQYRKGSRVPYITHLLNVAQILIAAGCDDEVVVAGLLHDVIEDTPVTIDVVGRKFGKRVALLVVGATEPERLHKTAGETCTWHQRKHHTIEYLRDEAQLDNLLLTCADKLDNARAIRNDQLIVGEEVWNRFKAGKEDQQWYYVSLAAILLQRSEEYGEPLRSMAQELDATVRSIFQ